MAVQDLIDSKIDCGESSTDGRVKTRRYTILGISKCIIVCA